MARIARLLALTVLAVHLLLALTQALTRTVAWGRQGLSILAWDLATSRRAALGDAWVDTIETLRRTIPRHGEYLLVNASTEQSGAPFWVRFELAPRRARFLGRLAELSFGEDPKSELAGSADWVVVAFPEPQPPRLLSRAQFLDGVEAQRAAR